MGLYSEFKGPGAGQGGLCSLWVSCVWQESNMCCWCWRCISVSEKRQAAQSCSLRQSCAVVSENVNRVHRDYIVYRVCRLHRVYRVHRVYMVYREYRVYKGYRVYRTRG